VSLVHPANYAVSLPDDTVSRTALSRVLLFSPVTAETDFEVQIVQLTVVALLLAVVAD